MNVVIGMELQMLSRLDLYRHDLWFESGSSRRVWVVLPPAPVRLLYTPNRYWGNRRLRRSKATISKGMGNDDERTGSRSQIDRHASPSSPPKAFLTTPFTHIASHSNNSCESCRSEKGRTTVIIV